MGGKQMKTKMNNKMLKVSLLVAIFATIQVPALFAQESSASTSEVAFVYESGAKMEIGDSVMINKDSLRYLTGERMSSWVYGVPHQIRQLGTKSKPAGVLLRGIYSWIAQGSLMPLNVEKTTETIERKKAEAAAAAAAIAAAEAAEEAARLKMLEELIEEEEVVEEVVKDTLPPAPQPYQINRFTVGVRGGLASLMPQTTPSAPKPLGATWGFDALLDLQYAHYWAKGEDKIRLGLLTGVSVGYMQNSKTLKDVTEQYTKHSEGDINYTIHMDEVTALNRQIQLEVPVMFSMITAKGFFLNAGPKFILPVHASFNQTLKNGDITANLVDMGVNVTENVVTGEIKEAKFVHGGMNDQQMDLTIAVGGELGYEHQLQSGHSVSVGLYANYGVFSTYKHNPTAEHIVDILPPTAEGVFQLTPNSMTNAYVNKLGYLDLGLKVAFHLNWKK